MKIRYLSDVHLEFERQPIGRLPKLPSIGEDVVVLAGDIHVGLDGIRWASLHVPDRPVIYILGNHEFYGHDWDGLVTEAKDLTRGTNIHLLENDSIVIEGIRFIGATLWTDFQLFGPDLQPEVLSHARELLYDFRAIRQGNGSIATEQMIDRCRVSCDYIRNTLAASAEPCVVVTHHSPSLANEHPAFRGKLSAACFHSDLDSLFVAPAKLWISGHTHYSSICEVREIPLVSNQRGYPRESVPFSWDACVEILARTMP